MYETDAELDALQVLLDTSLAGATEHLQSIIKPGERTLSARQLVRLLTGMRLLALSTVTAGFEPRVSAVDGHFLHGCWVFTTARGAAKARHLLARPVASAAYLEGEEVGVCAHGVTDVLNPADGPDDPEWPAVLEHLANHYGESPLNWGDIIGFRLRPRWIVAFASDPAQVLARL